MQTGRLFLSLAMVAALWACNETPSATPVESDAAGSGTQAADGETPDETETVSILRPDVEAEQPEQIVEEEPPLEPLNTIVGFPDGGDDIDDAALIALAEVLNSEQLALGGPIILRAHSDSAGSDAANARAAEERGLAVAEWMVLQGIDADRIDVIVFGEQNPIEPNALPDGSPNEDGRAANRRVEVLIVPPAFMEDGTAEAEAQ